MESNEKFAPAKAVEAILYVAARLGDPTMTAVGKALYEAEEIHRKLYERVIFGESALLHTRHGSLPRGAMELMKTARGDGFPSYRPLVASAFCIEDGNRVVPLREATLPTFTHSELECMNKGLQRLNNVVPSAYEASPH